jgi:hypothetical protein
MLAKKGEERINGGKVKEEKVKRRRRGRLEETESLQRNRIELH